MSFTRGPPQVYCLGCGGGRNIKEKHFERSPGYENRVTRKRYYRPPLLVAENSCVENRNSGMPLGYERVSSVNKMHTPAARIDAIRRMAVKSIQYISRDGRSAQLVYPPVCRIPRVVVSRLGRATTTNTTNVYASRRVGWVSCVPTNRSEM